MKMKFCCSINTSLEQEFFFFNFPPQLVGYSNATFPDILLVYFERESPIIAETHHRYV